MGLVTCLHCNGSGKVGDHKCPTCDGAGKMSYVEDHGRPHVPQDNENTE